MTDYPSRPVPPEDPIADTLLRMGPVSVPGRGRLSAETKSMIRSGLVTLRWISAREYVLVRTRKGNSLAKALFRRRGETVDGPEE